MESPRRTRRASIRERVAGAVRGLLCTATRSSLLRWDSCSRAAATAPRLALGLRLVAGEANCDASMSRAVAPLRSFSQPQNAPEDENR